jgi:two-component system nitrogen regulation sensor histidine kinase NtrY
MGFKRFRLRLLLRVGLLMGTLSVLVFLLFYQGWYVTAFCLTLLLAGQVYDFIYFVEKTNRDLTRFLAAIRQSDFTQLFREQGQSASFRDLSAEFNRVILAFQQIKADKEAHYLYLQTIVEHIAIGILSVAADGRIQLINRVTRELLQVPHLRNVKALGRISPELEHTVRTLEHGASRVVPISRQGEPLLLSLRGATLVSQGEELRIVSLQNIRSELEEQELEAWQKLIRVLTHEIMNSVTPIVSLTATISTLVEDELVAQTGGPAPEEDVLQDIRTGLQTIEKRSKGMLHFVENYRRLTRVPNPHLEPVRVRDLFEGVQRLLTADLAPQAVAFRMALPDPGLRIEVDPELIEQVLINLIKNGVEACRGSDQPCVEVTASLDAQEHNRVRIDVRDNGPGIPDEVLDKIFVPFFTTKKEGSGIGLSLSRQIMRLHKGTIRVSSTRPGQTVFSLVF